MKKTWKGIKDIININNKPGSQISQLVYKDKQITSNKGMANTFNEFFTDVGPNLDNEIPKNPRNPIIYVTNRILDSFLIAPTTPNEISDIIGALDDTKSSGRCSIPTKFLKMATEDIFVTFSEICNSSFEEGFFPEKNKCATVIPIHKNGSAKDVNNYRPISLLSTFSKIMEKLMATRLNNYLELHSIIYPKQYGFRAGFSTTHSLIGTTETINKTIEAKKYGCDTFIDLKKAFDTVNHKILLQKLEHYGIRGNSLCWFESYLTGRMQLVQLNGTDSDIKSIRCDVPQGSVLGPILFFTLYK